MRCRILRLLERQELTVSELVAALQLPQSSMSRHLKTLADSGFVSARQEGTSRWYALLPERLEPSARKLWALIRDQMAEKPVAFPADLDRLAAVLAERPTRSQEFFTTTAGRWDRLRDEIFGRSFDLRAVAGLLDPTTCLGDLACGTGRVSEAVAPFVDSVIAIDSSPAMLEAARARLKATPNVDVREGALEGLPVDDGALDAGTLFLALHHVADPARVLAEAHRAIREGGRLVVVDMLPHDREDYRQQMGHVWLGFSEKQTRRDLGDAGFSAIRVHPLPVDPSARGPRLFVASGVASGSGRSRGGSGTARTSRQQRQDEELRSTPRRPSGEGGRRAARRARAKDNTGAAVRR